MVFEDSSKTVLKDCVQRLFNYCPQRQCSNALFKDLVQRCFSTTSLYLHVFSFFPFVIPFFTHSFFFPLSQVWKGTIVGYWTNINTGQIQDHSQEGVGLGVHFHNSFAMLYNLCYAMPLYMCPNSGLIDTLLLYTDMHFSRYSDEITPSICWNRSQKKRHCTLNQKRHNHPLHSYVPHIDIIVASAHSRGSMWQHAQWFLLHVDCSCAAPFGRHS